MRKVDARFWKTDDRDGGMLEVFGLSIVPSSQLIEQKACLRCSPYAQKGTNLRLRLREVEGLRMPVRYLRKR